MRDQRFWLTGGQDVFLQFIVHFNYLPKGDIQIDLSLDRRLQAGSQSKRLALGASYTALTRFARFKFTVPTALRESLDTLGSFAIRQDQKQIHHDELYGVEIKPNTDYFEKVVVPQALEEMGFFTEGIGGRNKPDTIANHKKVNESEKFDVESTLTDDYDSTKWYSDTGKFQNYRQQRNLAHLLIVAQSSNISTDVVGWLNNPRDPIGLIEYFDLVQLRNSYRRDRDDTNVFATLARRGKISLSTGMPAGFNWIPARIWSIRREIGVHKR